MKKIGKKGRQAKLAAKGAKKMFEKKANKLVKLTQKAAAKAQLKMKKQLAKLAPNFVRRLSKKFGKSALRAAMKKVYKKTFQKVGKKLYKKLGKKAGKKAAQKLAKKAAKKAAMKAASAGAKAGAKASMGPVGWALLVVDLVSMALDLLNVGGYDDFEGIQMYLNEREVAKKSHNDYLMEQINDLRKAGVANPNVNYPRIIGPLDTLPQVEFNSELKKYEDKILQDKQKEFLTEALTKLSEAEVKEFLDEYVDRLSGEVSYKNIDDYKGKKWDEIVEIDVLNYLKILGWSKALGIVKRNLLFTLNFGKN